MTFEPLSTTEGQGSQEVTAKVVEGALRAIARFGLAKLTVDDVAREAGISRATLYRYFPGRGAVLAAMVQSETGRLQRGLDEALADVTSLPEALSAVAGFGARAFVGHEALQHLLATEPGAVLPHHGPARGPADGGTAGPHRPLLRARPSARAHRGRRAERRAGVRHPGRL